MRRSRTCTMLRRCCVTPMPKGDTARSTRRHSGKRAARDIVYRCCRVTPGCCALGRAQVVDCMWYTIGDSLEPGGSDGVRAVCSRCRREDRHAERSVPATSTWSSTASTTSQDRSPSRRVAPPTRADSARTWTSIQARPAHAARPRSSWPHCTSAAAHLTAWSGWCASGRSDVGEVLDGGGDVRAKEVPSKLRVAFGDGIADG